MNFFKSKYLIGIVAASLLIMGAFVGLQSFGLKNVNAPLPAPQAGSSPSAQFPAAESTSTSPTAPEIAEPEPAPTLSFTLKITKKGNVLLVRWENLPADAALLEIFRSKSGEDKWLLWRTLEIASSSVDRGGEDIALTRADRGNFFYYGEVTSAPLRSPSGPSAGEVLWTSLPAAPTLAPAAPPPSSSPTLSGAPPPAASQATTTPPSQSATTTVASLPQGGAPPPPPPQPGAAETITYYYTPQGQVSGSSAVDAAQFWVHHTDQKIEIGWQNLPTSTTKIIVFRSPNDSGPWGAILTQQNPDPAGPFKIKLDDETLRSAQYYKLEARAGADILAAYGPILLPAL